MRNLQPNRRRKKVVKKRSSIVHSWLSCLYPENFTSAPSTKTLNGQRALSSRCYAKISTRENSDWEQVAHQWQSCSRNAGYFTRKRLTIRHTPPVGPRCVPIGRAMVVKHDSTCTRRAQQRRTSFCCPPVIYSRVSLLLLRKDTTLSNFPMAAAVCQVGRQFVRILAKLTDPKYGFK